ncbi:septal ring lytic transglycosylase RlpA family protein [Pendulispora albinea]|uniref:Probable endolytic peptidoglycan transglycosylase RlpA n=1 Tax=Pendulispora albinea TaxID=2741071 RepID=A0ABZ2MCJ8_9BACT
MPPPPFLAQVAYLFTLATSFGGLNGCGGSSNAADRGFNAPANAQAEDSPGDYAFINGPAGSRPGTQPDQVGLASWYGPRFVGKKTASGERYDPRAMTAAHRKLPFGTWVEVRRIDTGSSVRVRITDRGPFDSSKKIIDLSRAAAEKIGLVQIGTTRVELRVVRGPE